MAQVVPDGEPQGTSESREPLSSEVTAQFHRAEANLSASPRRFDDAFLTNYVKGVLCRLDSGGCARFRLYIIADPRPSLTISPTAYLGLTTGLLLRVRDEGELAYVLGHALGHYRSHPHRDVPPALSTLSSPSRSAAVGASQVTPNAYSEEQEMEADAFAVRHAVNAGFDGRSGPNFWRRLLLEEGLLLGLVSRHPVTPRRLGELDGQVAALTQESLRGEAPAQASPLIPYREFVAPYRDRWIRDEFEDGSVESTQALLGQLFPGVSHRAERHYYLGELYRDRGSANDLYAAVAYYRRAILAGEPPVDVYRSLGLVYWQQAQDQAAREAFEDYLEYSPSPAGTAEVRSYLEMLGLPP